MDTPKQIDDGGPAFPAQDNYNGHFPGMTMRDWFAGQALVGVLANPNRAESGVNAIGIYTVADAMIAARLK